MKPQYVVFAWVKMSQCIKLRLSLSLMKDDWKRKDIVRFTINKRHSGIEILLSSELRDNPKTVLDEKCSKMVNSFFKTDVFDTLQIDQKPGETAIFLPGANNFPLLPKLYHERPVDTRLQEEKELFV